MRSSLKQRARFVAALLTGLSAGPGAAQAPDDSPDSVGFDIVELAASSPAPDTASASSLHMGASLRLQSALRTYAAPPGQLAKLRQSVAAYLEWKPRLGSGLQLRLRAAGRSEVDFEYLRHPTAYDAASNDVYAWQVLPGETFLALEGESFELAFGEQIVNFGQGEVLSVLDVVNPRDLREPLLGDLTALRMPVLMTRASASLEAWRMQLIAVHEPYFGLTPPPLGELSPFRKLLLDNPPLQAALAGRTLRIAHVPERRLDEYRATQWHARLSWSPEGLDLALLAASVLDGTGVPSLPDASALGSQNIELSIVHPRYSVFGHSGAWSRGPFVLRWEVAFELSRALGVRRTDTPLPLMAALRRDSLRGLLGLTYAPSATTSAALELAQSYVFYNPQREPRLHLALLYPLELPQLALRVSHTFFHERANLELLGLLIGVAPVNGWAARASLGYQLQDGLELRAGFVTYHGSDRFGYFYGLEHRDRVFMDLRWDLQSR